MASYVLCFYLKGLILKAVWGFNFMIPIDSNVSQVATHLHNIWGNLGMRIKSVTRKQYHLPSALQDSAEARGGGNVMWNFLWHNLVRRPCRIRMMKTQWYHGFQGSRRRCGSQSQRWLRSLQSTHSTAPISMYKKGVKTSSHD